MNVPQLNSSSEPTTAASPEKTQPPRIVRSSTSASFSRQLHTPCAQKLQSKASKYPDRTSKAFDRFRSACIRLRKTQSQPILPTTSAELSALVALQTQVSLLRARLSAFEHERHMVILENKVLKASLRASIASPID